MRRQRDFLDNLPKNFIGGSGGFNPNFDGNTLAWYDGNVDLTAARWNDQGAGGHDIMFVNLPTVVPNATPLRDAIRFDGINQNGSVATPVVNQPSTTYVVVNQVAWNLNSYVMDGGAINNSRALQQLGVAPNLSFKAAAVIDSNPDLAVGTFGVITCVANGAASEIRTNLNVTVVGNAGLLNSAGTTLGSRFGNVLFGNSEIGYLIIRTGVDSTATQNYVIDNLRVLCGLTF